MAVVVSGKHVNTWISQFEKNAAICTSSGHITWHHYIISEIIKILNINASNIDLSPKYAWIMCKMFHSTTIFDNVFSEPFYGLVLLIWWETENQTPFYFCFYAATEAIVLELNIGNSRKYQESRYTPQKNSNTKYYLNKNYS